MILADVNVLVAAFRPSHEHFDASNTWLKRQLESPAPFGLSERAVEGFIRIVTHPKVFPDPDPVGLAIEFAETLTARDNCVRIRPRERQWEIFLDMARMTNASGNAVADAWFAALAIENGCEWITWDKGFARYPGLKWSTPSLPA